MSQSLEVIAPTKMKLKEARLYENEWRLEVTANDGSVTTFPSGERLRARQRTDARRIAGHGDQSQIV